jgi:hypothetical protein
MRAVLESKKNIGISKQRLDRCILKIICIPIVYEYSSLREPPISLVAKLTTTVVGRDQYPLQCLGNVVNIK